jgi:hypothetical protein
MQKPLGLCAAFVLVLSSCGVKKDAEEMKRTSEEIRQQTDSVAKTSNSILEQSLHISKRTNDLESELVFERSYVLTLANLNDLFGKIEKKNERGPESHLSMDPDLLLYASGTMQSMYFQFWKGDFDEHLAVLDHRLELAADTLFARSNKHIPRSFKVNVPSPDRSYKAIASLGARLQDVRPEFTASLLQAGLKPFSFYDVLIWALAARDRVHRDEMLPKAVAKILHWRNEAIYLLQLRHNYLPIVVVGRMTDLQERNDFWKVVTLVVGQSVDIRSFDLEQLREWTRWLRQAMDTRAQLRSIGIEPQYNWAMHRMLKAVNFGQKAMLSMERSSLDEVNGIRFEFAEAYQSILEDYDKSAKGFL